MCVNFTVYIRVLCHLITEYCYIHLDLKFIICVHLESKSKYKFPYDSRRVIGNAQ